MRASFLRTVSALLPPALALAGCAAVPNLGPAPQGASPTAYAADRALAGAESGAWPAAKWWTGYDDPQLSALIEEALAQSPDVAAAAARVRRAQAIAQQAGAARLPSVGASASVSGIKQSYNNGIPATFIPKGVNDSEQVAANFSFDLDLWGKNRAAFAAARSDAEAARLDYAQAALMLSTTVADAYADLARLFAERSVTAGVIGVRESTRKLVADRVAAGIDTQAELKQASSAVPAGRAELGALDEQIALTRNRIAALLGKGPDRGLAITPPAVSLSVRGLPEDVTTDLIGRRPDIAAARSRVEGEASRIKQARAAFYPAINLTAMIGFQSLGIGQLFDSGSTFGSAGPAISLPIFRGGALQGQYRGARAGYDEAVANYDRTVADAYRRVADAVASRRSLDEQLTQATLALNDAQAAHDVARLRFQGGLSTFLDVLTAQERALQAQRIVADLKSRAFTIDVALVRALGGGFAAADAQALQTGPTTGPSTDRGAASASKDIPHG
ncbi:efflux transporter outer membrane subunit [Novosphingobium lentum]|uniref:efflux transporter outer membrane subunit n=1 Tax=Novosphingobium lentum TaxID=145287 RepID=UPI000A0708E0|nr:efflux transporter outer membrane subunit [Novosphingobium lentum]